MNSVLDTNDNPLTHVAIRLAESGMWTFTVRVPCVAGMFLTADVPDGANASVSARISGSNDAFEDIAEFPKSLTFFDGGDVDFDIRVEAADVAGLSRVVLPVRVTFNP